MNLKTLCDLIELQPSMKQQVLAFADTFDFATVQHWLDAFRQPDKMHTARAELQAFLGEENGSAGMLCCMLKASADLHADYQARGIGDDVYVATMKCFSRFVGETYACTGKYCFEHAWWAVRQAGGHLFRIGELEYEFYHNQNGAVISMHIPSDANFSRAACDASLAAAREFVARYYPQYSACAYTCHSWLLAPELKELLPETSNILDFQRRFDITVHGPGDLSFLDWVYQTRSREFQQFKEDTTLQRKLKSHLIGGGIISNASGTLKL